MPHTNRKKRNPARAHKPAAKSPYDVKLQDTLEYALAIPDLQPIKVHRYTFRFTNTQGAAAVLYTTAWSTAMMLDMYCMSRGSSTALRIFNSMRLRSVKMWTTGTATADNFGLEFSPALVAGFAGAPRIPIVGTKLALAGTTRQNYIYGIPKKNELASQWFTAQQPPYTLFNLAFPAAAASAEVTAGTSCLELDFDVVFINGESPTTSSFITTSAAGTIGTGAFAGYGVNGWRSVGLVMLV